MTPHDMGKLIYTLQQNKIFNARQTRPILHEFGTQEYPEEYRYGFYITPYLNRVNGVFLVKFLLFTLMIGILSF